MTYTFIAERCSDLPVAVCCRVMGVSTSGYYQRRAEPVTAYERVEAERANVVFDIWKMSRHSCPGSATSCASAAAKPARGPRPPV